MGSRASSCCSTADSLQGLLRQEVKRGKASQAAVLRYWNSAGSSRPGGTASSILLTDRGKKGKFIFWILLLPPQ